MLRPMDSLSRLKDEVNRLIPECAIHVDSKSPVWNEINAVTVENLHTHLSLRHSEAGTRYWKARGWGLLIWQPIYLAIIAAHKCHTILPLNEMGQRFSASGIPSGISFRQSWFKHGLINECIKQMAEDLIVGCHKVYSYWSVYGLSVKHADRMVADCVLSALIMVYRQRSKEAEPLGELWLETMGLKGASGFIPYKNISGEFSLALHKKNCCFRYLCHERVPCDVCPQQTMSERLRRLSQSST